ncbi:MULTISPECIES: LysR substrate-binding domain-containing protein [Burkholderia cepacia complex]|uniref:LysR substrate-binding domain-containing protein n=1 Tax=Burkholderia cepacia complex TaxID=87882 RepID=UPI0026E10D74|nr:MULTISPECIES: LysR substrate-binding domain-containing protein [Burkholderia cepacia complex]MDO5948164.1 LysR substrate-binding domain-containing protein [Burkholderia cepacia]MDS0803603.1 LysR substrate-binding domain-containing protein [Burkholderia cenocepacia]
MDLRQLRYFVKVVESGNVTRASAALHIAQPAVSQQIRNLENELGMLLLERSAQGVSPTAAGRTLHRHAIELLRQADRTRELLLQDAEMPQGKVSVGLPSSTSRVLAIPLARTIRARYPGITIELLEVPTADLYDLVVSGRVDLAVAADIVETPGMRVQRLLSEVLYLIAWPEFTLTHEPVKLADLARMPMVLPSAPNTIRSRVEWALQESGLSCEILFEASSTALLFAAVIARLGVTILPWTAAHIELDEQKLKLARVDHRLFTRDLSLCWRDTELLSNAALKVKIVMLELLNNLGQRQEWATARPKRRRR